MTARKPVRAVKKIKAWGGFVDGKLYVHRQRGVSYDEPRYAIFPLRKAAKGAYADVRRVTVLVTPIRRKRP